MHERNAISLGLVNADAECLSGMAMSCMPKTNTQVVAVQYGKYALRVLLLEHMAHMLFLLLIAGT